MSRRRWSCLCRLFCCSDDHAHPHMAQTDASARTLTHENRTGTRTECYSPRTPRLYAPRACVVPFWSCVCVLVLSWHAFCLYSPEASVVSVQQQNALR